MLALVVVVAEGNAQFVRQRAFLDAAHQNVRALFLHEGFQFRRVGVVQNDGAGIHQTRDDFIIFGLAGLGAHKHGFDAHFVELTDERDGLEAAAHKDGGLFAHKVRPVAVKKVRGFHGALADNGLCAVQGLHVAQALGHLPQGR